VLRLRYDFSAHPVPPKWAGLLAELEAEDRLVEEAENLEARLRREFRVPNSEGLRRSSAEFRALQQRLPDSVRMRELLQLLVTRQGTRELVEGLHLAGQCLGRLDGLDEFLPGYREHTAADLRDLHSGILESLPHLPELVPSLRDLLVDASSLLCRDARSGSGTGGI